MAFLLSLQDSLQAILEIGETDIQEPFQWIKLITEAETWIRKHR